MEKVTISNLQGESGLVNVVRYFLNNGSEFLIYSLNEVDESGYTRLYVTKLNGVDGNYTADTLNDTEWADIKNLVKVIVKANKEKLPIPVQDINPNKLKNIVLKDKKIFKLNTPLVNDLSANQPNFDDEDSNPVGGEQKTTFEIPGVPTFETPVQPAFEVPSAPTFEVPSAPTFETPVQPTFEMPSTPTFETPAQPTFETPVQSNLPNYNTFDFGATNSFTNSFESTNADVQPSENVQELKDEINRLNEEISKYKAIVENVKNIIEK